MNKSRRSWKSVNHKPTKSTVSKGPGTTFQEKKQKAEELKQLRSQLREFKEKKITRRK
jgi:hypothetical protein